MMFHCPLSAEWSLASCASPERNDYAVHGGGSRQRGRTGDCVCNGFSESGSPRASDTVCNGFECI